MTKYGFVYVWFDAKHKKYYIGRHWGTEVDGYVCSSNNMRNNYKNRPQDFKRRIVSRVYTSQQDLVLEEQRWLDMINPNALDRYYNKTLRSDSPSHLNFTHSEKAKQKISESMKGKKPSELNRINRLEACRGRIQSDKEKETRAQKLRGLKRSDKFKLRMKTPKPKVICPVCGAEGGKPVMHRFHFDNCNKYTKQTLEF